MKNKYFVAVLSFLVFSCTKIDESIPTAMDGNWTPIKKVILSGVNDAVLLTENASACKAKETYNFSADKKFVFTYLSDTNGTCMQDGTESGTYTYYPDTAILSLKYPNNSFNTFTVTKLTDTELTMWQRNTDYNGDGYKDKEVYYYKK